MSRKRIEDDTNLADWLEYMSNPDNLVTVEDVGVATGELYEEPKDESS